MAVDQLDIYKYQTFSRFLEQACGIVLGENKQYLVCSRLAPLLKIVNVATVDDLIDLILKGDRKASEYAIEAMTTNETLWFRDSYPFKLLSNIIFPHFATKKTPLRIWSAACSSGQEAYSIAMTLLDYKKSAGTSFRPSVEIVGTDISKDMLEHCKKGEYNSLSISRGLPLPSQQRYFDTAANGNLIVKPELKALTNFKPINLLDSYASLGKFDIVFCRNVLIYFSAEVKKLILQKIAACLQEDGILFLGASESISDLSSDFIMVRSSSGLYYQKKPQ